MVSFKDVNVVHNFHLMMQGVTTNKKPSLAPALMQEEEDLRLSEALTGTAIHFEEFTPGAEEASEFLGAEMVSSFVHVLCSCQTMYLRPILGY
jgi:hypothetical protein